MRTAVILLNLGGPTDLSAVRPFLRNLFSDPAILPLPNPFRYLLAALIAWRRTPKAQAIYQFLGGKSPLLENTQAQAQALEALLPSDHKVFIVMRYWFPQSKDILQDLKNYAPDRIILLPLYPQYSFTTTGSSFQDFQNQIAPHFPVASIKSLCCYPEGEGFREAVASLTLDAWEKRDRRYAYRLLFSAHGLPQRVIDQGDPYQYQVTQSVNAVVEKMGIEDLDFVICYQSKVGPVKWIGPPTEEEIERAGDQGLGVIVVPIAFVSEHSETLVELDRDYKKLAFEKGVPVFYRVPTVSCHPVFIKSLAEKVVGAFEETSGGFRCPPLYRQCPCLSSNL